MYLKGLVTAAFGSSGLMHGHVVSVPSVHIESTDSTIFIGVLCACI